MRLSPAGLSRKLFALLLLAVSAQAEDAPTYTTYEDMASYLRTDVADFPNVASLSVIGKSTEGREILLLTIGTGKDVATRPALLVIGGLEGDGMTGSALAAAAARELIMSTDERVKKLLAERTVYVIPRLNPDGVQEYFGKVKRAGGGTARPWDEDKDGAVDEDGPDDLDGDGQIVMMRVEDPAGEWVADEKDAGFMRKADVVKGERGAWKVMAEGKDDDGDGAWNEDGPGGVDLNSNFPWNYKFHGARSGPFQVSEPESRALADFVASHPNIVAAFTFSSNDNCARQVAPAAPPSPPPDPGSPVMGLDAADVLFFAKAADGWRQKLGRERRDPGPLHEGGCAEWLYFHWGILSLASPGWSPPWKAGDANGLPNEDGPSREARWLHRWLKANRASDWVEWHAVEHPDFPGRKVEVGGWKPRAATVAAEAEIRPMAAKHAAVFADMLEAFPRISWKGVAVKKLDGALWQVTATLSNDGAMPAALRQGERTRRARPIRVEIAGGDVMTGDRVALVPSVAAGGVKEMTWVVHAAEGASLELRAGTDRTGDAVEKVTLK